MALVCDIKSENKVEPADAAINEDLEDGEIEDDEEEVAAEPEVLDAELPAEGKPQQQQQQPPPPNNPEKITSPFVDHKSHEKYERPKYERSRSKHEEKKKGHLTEAEKSVMFLHKLERMEREKREKYRREPVDDFASNIEKAIASVLRKDKTGDEEQDDEKRGKKRKKKERERKKKERKMETSPKSDEVDENEMLNVRGISPEHNRASPRSEEFLSEETDYSTDKSSEERREKRREKRERKGRNRNRDRMKNDGRDNKNKTVDQPLRDPPEICVYYLQGKCHKRDDCQYSHETQPPMKWELCKFYLNDCCAKGDKCLYMHSDFPCKFYHTGQPCLEGENCKFAHGKPLSERLKQILFKHIETAPKDILGRFPRMNREEAAFKINQTQKQLENKYGIEKKDGSGNDQSKTGIPSLFDLSIPVPVELSHDDSKPKDKMDKPTRNRPSRWQEADPIDRTMNMQDQRQNLTKPGFKTFSQDLDMRLSNLPLTSNGDVDMRTLPPMPMQPPNMSQPPPNQSMISPNVMMMLNNMQRGDDSRPLDIEQYKREAGFSADSTIMDVDIRSIRGDTDIRNHNNLESMTGRDVDIRKMDVDSRHQQQEQQMELFDTRDVDIRQQQQSYSVSAQQNVMEDDCDDKLEIVVNDEPELDKDNRFDFDAKDLPATLPKRQRELFLRIQAQQKENLLDEQADRNSEDDQSNIDWYSDDSNEGKLTIKCDEDVKEKEEEGTVAVSATPSIANVTTLPPIKPSEMVEKLGDLSKINISEEVTKLLSSIRQNNAMLTTQPSMTSPKESGKPKDPRQGGVGGSASSSGSEEHKHSRGDPRKARVSSTEDRHRPGKISIYEQGSIDTDSSGRDVDLRSIDKDLDMRPNFGDLSYKGSSSLSGRPDVDLRQLSLPFKAMQNYTPASEIDASYSSHLPIVWTVHIVDIPRPDYTGLKLSKQEAQTTGDPRLRKIFRLDVEEKDSPASPKQSPKSTPSVRVDPRIRKAEEAPKSSENSPVMTYAQQMNVLQGSSFYQNLTSNQKVMLNQELSTNRDQQTGMPGSNEQVLAGILSALGLLQSQPGPPPINGNVLSLLSTLSNISHLGMNPNILNQNPNILNQNPNMNPGPNAPNHPGMMGQNPNMLGQNLPPNMNQNPNMLPPGQQVNPNLLGQNPNMVGQLPPNLVQPGLLGAAPGIPNLAAGDFPINFDPRNGGLLGNAPPFVGFQPQPPQQQQQQQQQQDNQNFNFANDDFFPENPMGGGGGGGGPGGGNFNNNRGDGRFNNNRDNRPRRGRNFNRNNRNNNFRNRNRANRGHAAD